MELCLLRAGFDTIEYALPAIYPPAFYERLSEAKTLAVKSRKPYPTDFNGQHFFVRPSGGQGGYEFLLDTGPYGLLIKIRSAGSGDDWTSHVKFSSHGLATKGVEKMKSECDQFILSLGGVFNHENLRMSRVDYALDFYAPGLEIRADHIVAHARMTKQDYLKRVMRGDRSTSLLIGKMPNRQVSIYDKSLAISDKRDLVWQDIFRQLFKIQGLPFENRDILRVELRAGKNAIEKYATPRFFDTVMAVAEILFANIARNVRWVEPGIDSNRSRWPLHPIWTLVQAHIQDGFHTFMPIPISDATRAQIAEEYISQLQSQSDGVTLTLAAAFEIEPKDIGSFVRKHFTEMGNRFSQRADLEDQLRTRMERQALMFDR